MSIESWRWYQWLPIGLALGAVIGGVRVGIRERFEDSPARTIGRADLDTALSAGLPDGGPAVTSMTVHPPRGDGVWWVTGNRVRLLQLHTDPHNANSPLVDAEVRTPFKLASGGPQIWDELTRTHASFPQTSPQPAYAWQEVPVMQIALWTVGIGVLVGGIWPPVMALLIGAGFGRRTNEPAYDLNAFLPETVATETPPLPYALVPNGDSERELSSQRLPEKPKPVVSVATLSSAPSDPAAPPEPQAPKSYAGQFYPTQVHVPAPPPPRQRPADS